ncbi:protease B nonderepressible form [Penicillium ochrochloron]
MKRRVTYVQHPETPFEPHQASLSSTTVSVRDLDAAREDRITFGLEDLPEELRAVLEQSHELRLRWATERSFDAIAPFASRISPGLHVHYTPLASDQSSEALCSLLRVVFGTHKDGEAVVDCTTPEDSFITPPLLSTRFAAAASLQYYTRLPSLPSLVAFIRRTACHQQQVGGTECHDRANSLLTADTVDVDYDSISHALTISGVWAGPPSGGWTEDIPKPSSKTDQVEFGLLGAEQGIEPEEIKMGGLLAVVGEDKKMKPTMFSFPSRHHPLPSDASYSVSFTKPTGLHPTMSITLQRPSLERPPAPEDATCALHTYLTLPSSVFGDQYQLGTTDPLFLESHNLATLRAHAGEMDLEAPDWAVQRWGSTWLFELAKPTVDESDKTSNWTATIPLHLRYLPPSETGYRTAHVPWPVVFWACTAEDGTKMGVNPFDRTNLGWDGLFGPRTMFYQLHPESGRLVEEIEVPVLKLKEGEGLFKAQNIELGTSLVISLGFLWVLWRLVQVALSRSGQGRGQGHEKKE